jgi:hypothetical protein
MKTTKLLIAAIVFIAFGITSCGSGASMSDTPGDAVKKAFTLLKEKDYASAAKFFAAEDRLATEEETKKIEGMMAIAYVEFEKKGGIKEILIEEETIAEDGKTAKVKYNLKFNNGSDDSNHQSLQNFEGKWYLDVVTH